MEFAMIPISCGLATDSSSQGMGNQTRGRIAIVFGASSASKLRYPITGSAGCCTRATSGQAAAALPRPAMNVRRFTESPRQPWPTAFPER